MPEAISRTQKGNTVIVWFYGYDEDENLASFDELPTIEVWKDKLRVIGPVVMAHYGIGVVRYELDTETMSPGRYRIVCRGAIQGKAIVQDTTLTITQPWLEE